LLNIFNGFGNTWKSSGHVGAASLSARILRSIIGLIDFYAFDRRPALTILEANDVMAGDGGAGLLARLGFWPFPG
jgi:hypothetical protein